jgi:hypothetical protein
MAKKKIVVTGAAGHVTGCILDALRERYDLVLLDVTKESKKGTIDDIVIADVSDPDIEKYRHHFKGAYAAIHHARVPNQRDPKLTSGPNRQWIAPPAVHPVEGYIAERTMLDMAYNVYKCALLEGVKRVIVASSNHATDWYESKLHFGKMDIVDSETYPKSDNLYGWAKIAYEALGFVFASGRFGKVVESVNIRIGAPRDLDIAALAKNQTSLRRDLACYISDRDMSQLYVKSIDADDIRDKDGVPFQAFYGVSNNARSCWSIVNAREVIGYDPEDDSELVYAEELRKHLKAPGKTYAAGPE